MWIEDYQWHYDYVRLAWDTGFSFEKCKSPNFDRNKICAVDIERIVKERDVASVDRYIATVVQYILDEEQSKLLDNNFVKLFKISQLAVEYLLFCKKYLDNTVVLLKKELAKNREEIKELKLLCDDLQKHVETLTRHQVFTTFKCPTCPKAFSSEEYLSAHAKRRHSTVEGNHSNADKLNMEIKELKERLNNTEKLLMEQKEQCPENGPSEKNDKLQLAEVLDKFETFKVQVDDELKKLKLQKTFYEENYGKLFDIVVSQNKENVCPKPSDKAETTTQTDKVLHLENVNNKNVTLIEDCESAVKEAGGNKVNEDTRRDSLEAKISSTLAGIENQMQSFCAKLNDLQLRAVTQTPQNHEDKIGASEDAEAKPKAKPRSKFTQPTGVQLIQNNSEALKKTIEKMELAPPAQPYIEGSNVPESQQRLESSPQKENKLVDTASFQLKRQSVVESSTFEESDTSEAASSTLDSNLLDKIEEDKKTPSPKLTVPRKVSKRSVNKIDSARTLANIEKDIESLVFSRLQELGISETWTRLPERSFTKAFEIINHQATLTKKTHRNFSSIKNKLIDQIGRLCKSSSNKNQTLQDSNSPTKGTLKQNIVKISYRPKSGRGNSIQRTPNGKIDIKNREVFDTDSETEEDINVNPRPLPRLTDLRGQYSNVIEEIKGLPKLTHHQSDRNSSDEVHKRDEQRGVLKSFPSVGSLSKKKVFFDLESDSVKAEDVPVLQKTGGSTTSVASSIFGDKVNSDADDKKKEIEEKEDAIKVIEKEFEDLSDFDLSV